jgi:peptidyl-prolyl cis-trans isomerase SurA
MKRNVLIILSLLLAGEINAGVCLDRVVAVVNSEVITKSELDNKIDRMKRSLLRAGSVIVSDALLHLQALDELIDASLQVQLARINKIQVSDKELNEVIANIAKSNGLTVEQFEEVLPSHEGISFSRFRNELRENGLISKVQQIVLGKEIVISDTEIDEILKKPFESDDTPPRYHVLDLLFEIIDCTNNKQLSTVTDEANKAAKRLRYGNKVDDIVRDSRNNLKKKSRVYSNDLGWRGIDDLPEIFANEITKMKINQVVGPIIASNGLHLLKLLEIRKDKRVVKLRKEQAYEILYHRKLTEKLKPWLKDLRSKSYVEIIN